MLLKIVFLLFVAVLQVSAKRPSISNITSDLVVNVGDNVEFNCTVHDLENFGIGWSKIDDEEAPVVLSVRDYLTLPDSRYNISEAKMNDSKVSMFKIEDVQASDMGIYECQVYISTTEKVRKKLKLSVRHPALISDEKTSKSVVVTEKGNVEVTCHADGYPEPRYSWKREENSIMPAGGHTHRGATLHVRNAHHLDRGVYYCVADNGVGLPDERIVRIEVEFRPRITVHRPKVAQLSSYPAQLECTVVGYPPPAVFWYKDGSQILSGGNYDITNMAYAHETTSSILRIKSVAERDYGDYYCNATNKLGSADEPLNLFRSPIPVVL